MLYMIWLNTSDTHLKGNPLGVGKIPMSPSFLEAASDINLETPDTFSTRGALAMGMTSDIS